MRNKLHFNSIWFLVPIIGMFLIAGCSSTPRIYGGSLKEARAHQVTEIMEIASKEQIIFNKPLYDPLIQADISESDIQNGTVAVGRVYCCGGEGTVEYQVTAVVYVPSNITVNRGDILEFVVGAGSDAPKHEQINRAVKVRHEDGIASRECRWEPENPRLWMRVIYCPWMEQEGWKKGGGLSPVWYKPVE